MGARPIKRASTQHVRIRCATQCRWAAPGTARWRPRVPCLLAPLWEPEGRMMSTSIFDNLDALRLSPDSAAIAGTREVLAHVAVRKPNRMDFIRTHPDPAMSLATAIFEDKAER